MNRSIQDGAKTLSSPSKKTRKFDWTKIHLVYFLLAAFDLVAIISGLSLSEWSKNAHMETVLKLDQVNFLRGEVARDANFSVKLSVIGNDIFATQDTRTAKRDLSIMQSFNNAMSNQTSFYDRLYKKFPLATGIAADLSPKLADPSQILKRLNRLDPEMLKRFDTYEKTIRQTTDVMFSETLAAIKNYETGNSQQSTVNMSQSDSAFRQSLSAAFATNAELDNALQDTVKNSEAILNKSTLLQYIVGGSIFILIGLACAYAFYVGRVLHSKFIEIQKAHEESTQHAAFVENINEGVTKLNGELADSMKRLTEAQDELVKKGRMEQLGQLTATVAHELRNPLGAVRTSSFLLERKLRDKGLNVESQLQRIAHGVSRCDNIITQLLDFSRTNKLVCQEADLDQWLIKTVEDIAKQLPIMVSITCDLGLQEKNVPFDGARLQRAILNLVSNASEAMVGNGTEASKIVTENPEIIISTAIEGDAVLIRVTDNGPGMSPEILSKVRDPLFTTKSFGTGLGISAVEQIAYQHGGKLEISSTVGVGSTFTLNLPMPIAVAEAA